MLENNIKIDQLEVILLETEWKMLFVRSGVISFL